MGRSTAERSIAVYDKVAYIKGNAATRAWLGWAELLQPSNSLNLKPSPTPLGPMANRILPTIFQSGQSQRIGDWKNSNPPRTTTIVKFVGKINDNGLFTPNLEGPNPERKKQSNNYPTNKLG